MNYFDVKEKDGIISKLIKKSLEDFVKEELYSLKGKLAIIKVILPWRRMFEVDIEVNYSERQLN